MEIYFTSKLDNILRRLSTIYQLFSNAEIPNYGSARKHFEDAESLEVEFEKLQKQIVIYNGEMESKEDIIKLDEKTSNFYRFLRLIRQEFHYLEYKSKETES